MTVKTRVVQNLDCQELPDCIVTEGSSFTTTFDPNTKDLPSDRAKYQMEIKVVNGKAEIRQWWVSP